MSEQSTNKGKGKGRRGKGKAGAAKGGPRKDLQAGGCRRPGGLPQPGAAGLQADGVPLVEPVAEQTCTSRGIQTVPVIRCPWCRSASKKQYGRAGGPSGGRRAARRLLYYRCRRCRGKYKVREVDPRGMQNGE